MSIGFIILRHVNNETTDKYWIECYNCIRKFYPDNKIMIVDDNSNYDFISNIELVNTVIINSEYIGRGEILPYYYFFENKLFDRAVILHDSTFIQQFIDFGPDNIFLWEFEHYCDEPINEINLIEKLNISSDNKLLNNIAQIDTILKLYSSKHLWVGCFGAMSVISHDYLSLLNNKYNLLNLVHHIKCRNDRMNFERVFAVLFTLEKNIINKASIYGIIHKYCKWNYKYQQYILDKHNNIKLPIVKVWSGR
jgi:hypothetical protein